MKFSQLIKVLKVFQVRARSCRAKLSFLCRNRETRHEERKCIAQTCPIFAKESVMFPNAEAELLEDSKQSFEVNIFRKNS